MRNVENRVSRDADIVVAAMLSIVGSTLIFQGWRLDPLLLLCQVRACGACSDLLRAPTRPAVARLLHNPQNSAQRPRAQRSACLGHMRARPAPRAPARRR